MVISDADPYRYHLVRIRIQSYNFLRIRIRIHTQCCGAGAGRSRTFLLRPEPGKKLRLRAVAVRLPFGGKEATILIKFSQILTIYTQIERKNRYEYTFKKAKLFTLVFKTVFFTQICV